MDRRHSFLYIELSSSGFNTCFSLYDRTSSHGLCSLFCVFSAIFPSDTIIIVDLFSHFSVSEPDLTAFLSNIHFIQ